MHNPTTQNDATYSVHVVIDRSRFGPTGGTLSGTTFRSNRPLGDLEHVAAWSQQLFEYTYGICARCVYSSPEA